MQRTRTSPIHARALVFTALACSPATAQSTPPILRELHRMFPPEAPLPLLGDLDGDGDLDALVTPATGSGVLLNEGDARFVFRAPAVPHVHPYTKGVLADVDGDADLDLVSVVSASYQPSNCSAGPYRLHLNDGTAQFVDAPAHLPFAGSASDVEAADVDGDGDLDLVVAGYTVNYCDDPDVPAHTRLLLNDGQGYFHELPTAFSASLSFASGVALGDIDGDGDPDLLIGDDNGVQLWRNDALSFTNVSFRLPAIAPISDAGFGDLDADGDRDLITWGVSGANSWINDGSGTFQLSSGWSSSSSISAVALVDLDADGDLDLLHNFVQQQGGRAYLNDGTGTFTDVTATHLPGALSWVEGLALGDLDGDGDVDALLPDGSSSPVRLNDGAGRLLPLPIPNAGNQSVSSVLAAGDVNADGFLDLVGFAVPGNSLGAYFGDGRGGFTPDVSPQPSFTGVGRDLALVDFDGDGDLDVFASVVHDSFGGFGVDQLFLNDGAGRFGDASSNLPLHSDETRGFDCGDVDLDGDVDILLVNAPQPNRVYLNDGLAHFVDSTSSVPLGGGQNVWETKLADVDGDGDLDVYVGRTSSQAIHFNDGNGAFEPNGVALAPLAAQPMSAEFGDVDGDSDLELVVGLSSTPTVRLFINDGAGSFSEHPSPIIVTAPYANWTWRLQLVDLDEDSDLDIVAIQQLGAVFLQNDGFARFTDRTDLLEVRPSFLLDFDLDGDLDGVSTLATNTLRQVAWRQVPRIGRELDIDLFGSPNGHFILAAARDPLVTASTPFGALGLSRSTIFRIDKGQFDASGRASVRVDVPDNPALVGRDYFWQARVGRPARWTNVERTLFSDL